MSILFTAVRKSDGKTLYFYDNESREDYIDTYDEELTDYGFALEAPFGEQIIDINQERNELRNLFNMSGMTMPDNVLQDLYKQSDNSDEDEKIAKLRKMSKHTFNVNNNNELEEIDDDPYEVTIRKQKLDVVQLFKSFYDALEDDRKKIVRNTFKKRKLDIDKLDEYIDQEINMNIDVYLQDYDTESAFKAAEQKYKKTTEYKKHNNFMKTINESYDAIYKMDEAEDIKKLQK